MNFTTAGDLGDIIAMMCVMKAIPNAPHTLLLQDRQNTAGITRRHHVIAPLAESQPYIKECRPFQVGDTVQWHSADFRIRHHFLDKSLIYAHGTHAASVGLLQHEPDPSAAPWVTVTPEPSTKGKITIARSTRYRNAWFPWEKVVKHYGLSSFAFLGMPDEHADFCQNFGQVEYFPTDNLLQVAKLIAGSSLFIGNQSSPYWCAQAMHHPRILEVCLHVADSICSGGDAQFVADGGVTLPSVNGSTPTTLHPSFPYTRSIESINTSTSPPGGWHYQGLMNTSLSTLVNMVKRAGLGDDHEAIRKAIIEENVKRRPDFFKDDSHMTSLNLYQNAMRYQGLKFNTPTA